MLSLSPKAKWNLSRVFPFGLIWFVTAMVFLASDALAIGGNPVMEGGVRPNEGIFVLAGTSAFIMGLMVGTLEMIFVNRLFRDMNLWKTFVGKFLLYLVLFTLMVALLFPIAAALETNTSLWDERVGEKFIGFWGSPAFWSTALQLVFSLILCLFYAAISENLGQSVLVNFVTGKYHSPKEEERIFLFLDMYDSTTIAEDLGHIRYFEFLRRYYDDLANAIIQHEGEVYQYIGDEIVITWTKQKGLRNHNCVRCFFAMERALEKKAKRYQKDFGHIPRFKGGMHLGAVTTGEVGALKKEIVYTGDVLNTSARIQGLCKTYDVDLLLSEDLITVLGLDTNYELRNLGSLELKGKKEEITVYSVQES